MKHVEFEQSEAAPPVQAQPQYPALARVTAHPSRVLRVLEAARTSFWAAIALTAAVSTYVGVVYWIAQGWVLGVVLSALVPGFGLISTAWSLAS